MHRLTQPSAIRLRNYQLFAAGFVCSSTGLQILTATILWEVWERTHSPLALGYCGVARALPVIAFAIFAGHFADHRNRKRIVAFTQFLFAVCALAFAAAAWWQVRIEWLYALLFVSGTVRAFNGPARASLLPLIVPVDRFENAVAWNSTFFQAAAIAGPLVAGAMIAATDSVAWNYLLVAALTMTFSITIGLVTQREEERSTAPFSVHELMEGVRHIWREKLILGTISLDLLAVLLGGATALLPLYADEILHTGPVGYGFLRAAPFIGAFLCAVWMAHRPPLARAGPALLWSVAGFGVCMILFGVSTSMIVSSAALIVSGALDNVSVIVRHVLVQTRTPNRLRGRVTGVNSMFIESSNELGAFESGLVAAWIGPVLSVVTGGIGTLFVVGAVAWRIPQLRRLGRMVERTA